MEGCRPKRTWKEVAHITILKCMKQPLRLGHVITYSICYLQLAVHSCSLYGKGILQNAESCQGVICGKSNAEHSTNCLFLLLHILQWKNSSTAFLQIAKVNTNSNSMHQHITLASFVLCCRQGSSLLWRLPVSSNAIAQQRGGELVGVCECVRDAQTRKVKQA